MSRFIVRARRGDDMPALETLVAAVRAVDGYPPDTPNLFPVAPAFVALDRVAVVGHVALHDDAAEEVMVLATDATGCLRHALVVVSRLLVAPDARRQGVGRLLLRRVVEAAHAQVRRPVLDVSTSFASAIALYDSCGWQRAGRVSFSFDDGGVRRRAQSFVYLEPAPSLGRDRG